MFLGYAQTLIFPPFLSNQTLLPIFVGQPQSKWRTFVVNFSRDPPGKEAVFGSAHSLRRKLKGGRESRNAESGNAARSIEIISKLTD